MTSQVMIDLQGSVPSHKHEVLPNLSQNGTPPTSLQPAGAKCFAPDGLQRMLKIQSIMTSNGRSMVILLSIRRLAGAAFAEQIRVSMHLKLKCCQADHAAEHEPLAQTDDYPAYCHAQCRPCSLLAAIERITNAVCPGVTRDMLKGRLIPFAESTGCCSILGKLQLQTREGGGGGGGWREAWAGDWQAFKAPP